MNHEDWNFESEQQADDWYHQCYLAEEMEKFPSDKMGMLFCKDKAFVRLGLRALNYDVTEALKKSPWRAVKWPDMQILVELFCEKEVTFAQFIHSFDIICTTLLTEKEKCHPNWRRSLLELLAGCDRWSFTVVGAYSIILEIAEDDPDIAVLWIQEYVANFRAPLVGRFIAFCERHRMLPALSPVLDIWRPRDSDDSSISFDRRMRLPFEFGRDPAVAGHDAMAWFWPRLQPYHVQILRRMLSSCIDAHTDRALADYTMRICLGLRGANLSALPIARIVLFSLLPLICENEEDALQEKLLRLVAHIFDVRKRVIEQKMTCPRCNRCRGSNH